MKKTGVFKAMKLCMDYKKMPADKREQVIEALEIYNRACAEIEIIKECDCNES